MNVQPMLFVVSGASGVIAFVMGMVNPFFENKKMVFWMCVAFAISVVSLFFAVGIR